MTDPSSRCIRNEILAAGVFERFEGKFASAKPANNKLDLGKLNREGITYERLVCGMADLIVAHHVEVEEIDFLAAIPFGGDDFAMDISDVLAPRYRIPVVLFRKVETADDSKKFAPRGCNDRTILSASATGVIVDDVTNEFTSLVSMISVPELAGINLTACSGWHRGDPEIVPPIEVYSVVDEYIQRQLPDDSPYWQYVQPS